MAEELERQSLEKQLGLQDGMYIGHFSLDPDTTVTLEDVVTILRAMDIRFGPKEFVELPKEVRKHFIVHDRKGNEFRYGRTPRHLK